MSIAVCVPAVSVIVRDVQGLYGYVWAPHMWVGAGWGAWTIVRRASACLPTLRTISQTTGLGLAQCASLCIYLYIH